MTSIHRLPPPRGIDHLVIAARDLDALAAHYRQLGFTVGPRNTHPWGTENHIVQMPGCFLELIGVGHGAAIPEQTGRAYSFGGFVRDYLAQSEGLAMLVLESNNAIGDAEDFRKAGIGNFEPFFFERSGIRADGSVARVAFTLAFAKWRGVTGAGFFTCQQHEPQNFWNPAVQTHENGVTGIARVTMVADDPSDMHEFLGAFIRQREMRATSFGIELDTGRGIVEVLSRTAFRFRFGVEPPGSPALGPQFAAITFNCAKPSVVAAQQSGQPITADKMGVIPAELATGVVLAFVGK
ncbi:MAG: VOC family protein [Proteobacteria bacterium]|nr:VOC family protein [Pseudomonadota bacterium]